MHLPTLFRPALVLCAVILALPVAARAQTEVEPGARVRILAPSTADTLITGTLSAIDSATLLLAVDADTAGVHVPLAAIRRLEVEADPAAWGRTGGLLGLVAGGAAVYLASPCPGHDDGCQKIRTVYAIGGAAAGMLLGSLIGRGAARGRWRPVPVPAP